MWERMVTFVHDSFGSHILQGVVFLAITLFMLVVLMAMVA